MMFVTHMFVIMANGLLYEIDLGCDYHLNFYGQQTYYILINALMNYFSILACYRTRDHCIEVNVTFGLLTINICRTSICCNNLPSWL